MSVMPLKAHSIGKQVCLDEPRNLPPDFWLLMLLAPEVEPSVREKSCESTRQSVDCACGDDESNYLNLMPQRQAASESPVI
ncbi:MAG: hypothetical protein EXS31_04090 [Pedosphaera sp.]|nr:hypothetical protein [Pedosphaera sp.]